MAAAMSVALHSGRGVEVEPPGFSIGAVRPPSAFDPPELDSSGGEGGGAAAARPARSSSSSSLSSSIGKDSDDTGNRSSGGGGEEEEDGEEHEVQSFYKGPLEMMDALEEVLPMRRGISKFYDGKSKSFTSLADASSSSVKEIAKPENAFSRRRRNMLASSYTWDKSRNFPLRSNIAGISKRPLSSSKSTLALAVAMCNSESFSSTSEDSSTSSVSRSPPRLPPLHPRGKGSHNQIASPQRNFSPWRSYSLADLQQCANRSSSAVYDSVTEKADFEDIA
ncbi:protein OXIDATIVE STRESS 3 LIKE 1 [Syzygium oleosum]|uniref:protein OXIDATIVE STRESS 3 LIKE 1 n=1 Tax=Syzygium oleosum TaxID=219896 RepID=UPI0011D203E6|nr:protein OXIDATIVE STRESS 3 LIKE 1 [Syzygium oleosum]